MKSNVIKHIMRNKGFTYNLCYHWYEKNVGQDIYFIELKELHTLGKDQLLILCNNLHLNRTVEQYNEERMSPKYINRRRP